MRLIGFFSRGQNKKPNLRPTFLPKTIENRKKVGRK
jgi:hypothetical protein